MFDHVGDRGEAVHSPQLAIYSLPPESVTHGGMWFDRLEPDAATGWFSRHRGERMRALISNTATTAISFANLSDGLNF